MSRPTPTGTTGADSRAGVKRGVLGAAFMATLTMVLLLGLNAEALAATCWSDAPSSWWMSSYGVTDADVAGVADGYPDGTFLPVVPVTRGQFAKMATRGLGVATADPGAPTFADVPASHLFFTYIEGAHAGGLIGGYQTGSGLRYRPQSNITRQQAMSILARYLSQLELDTTGVVHGDVIEKYGSLELWYNSEGKFWLNGYDDSAQVASDHRATTAYLVSRGVVEGSNWCLNPTATLARSQAAALVLRVKAAAADIRMPPGAPRNLDLVATGAQVNVTPTEGHLYVGNDPTPRLTGNTLPDSHMTVYDEPFFGTAHLKREKSNLAGRFYVDLDDPLRALADGTHRFTATVTNGSGLESPASEAVTYLLDTLSPTGSITSPTVPSPEEYALVHSASPPFTVVATDQGSGVESVRFQVATDRTEPDWETVFTDTAPEPGTACFAALWPAGGPGAAGLPDGRYLLRAVVTDRAGNEHTVGPVKVRVETPAAAQGTGAPTWAVATSRCRGGLTPQTIYLGRRCFPLDSRGKDTMTLAFGPSSERRPAKTGALLDAHRPAC